MSTANTTIRRVLGAVFAIVAATAAVAFAPAAQATVGDAVCETTLVFNYSPGVTSQTQTVAAHGANSGLASVCVSVSQPAIRSAEMILEFSGQASCLSASASGTVQLRWLDLAGNQVGISTINNAALLVTVREGVPVTVVTGTVSGGNLFGGDLFVANYLGLPSKGLCVPLLGTPVTQTTGPATYTLA